MMTMKLLELVTQLSIYQYYTRILYQYLSTQICFLLHHHYDYLDPLNCDIDNTFK